MLQKPGQNPDWWVTCLALIQTFLCYTFTQRKTRPEERREKPRYLLGKLPFSWTQNNITLIDFFEQPQYICHCSPRIWVAWNSAYLIDASCSFSTRAWYTFILIYLAVRPSESWLAHASVTICDFNARGVIIARVWCATHNVYQKQNR